MNEAVKFAPKQNDAGDDDPSFAPMFSQMPDATAYLLDAWQRSVLFLDVLRQRGNAHFERNEQVAPNVLRFDFELIVDGRQLARPVNYALVRIRAPDNAPISSRKRPFIVFDPRAGHGPGIGGMKRDSEIGMALGAGHPCYFVGFLPVPVPGQTIEDVCRAEAAFIAAVIERHPEADGKPCLVGNCQAGWQIMLTAAIRPDLAGPIILAGAPLSYWQGVHGKAPMRYTGGVLGGSWLASFNSDLGAGIFDGAALVQNFENLNPANSYWTKNYNLYSKIDTEEQRFLDFEKWWGNPVLLNGDEIQFIVDELFIGNKLTDGEIRTTEGIRVDLRNILSPIVVFCSHGDDITPPQQALGWVLDLYDSDEDLIASGQTIIYSLHPDVGHLGIFVSGSVATKQHQEFAQNIDFIDVLPPGLYEACFQAKDGGTVHAELLPTDYVMSFQHRSLADIRALGGNDDEDDLRFAAVARLSEINQGLYRTLFQPIVRAASSSQSADLLRRLNPLRVRFELFSDKNPFLAPIAAIAETVRLDRRPVPPDNPFLALQTAVSEQIIHALDGFRDARDHWVENVFLQLYGSPLVQAAVGLRSDHAEAHRKIGRDVEREAAIAEQIGKLRSAFGEGGEPEAIARALVYLLRAAPDVDERSFAMMRQLRGLHASVAALSLSDFKVLVRRQYLLIRLDEEQAIASLPALLKRSGADHSSLLALLRQVVSAAGEISPAVAQRLQRLERLFGGKGKAPS
jgi:hypothetical protein